MAARDQLKLSAEERRNLDIEIGFLSGLTRRDPTYIEALRLLGDAYTRRGKYTEGLEVDEQLTRLQPSDPIAQYNLACSYSLTDQPAAAFRALHRAIDCGFRDFRALSRDPDLARFRKHPLYRKLRERIRTLKPPTR